MKLQKIRYFLIGLGFFWIFCATILGSLIGTKINTILAHDPSSPWMLGLQKMLLISAHSHLNLMAIVTILIGVVLEFLWGRVSTQWVKAAVACNVFATPLFVCGLLLKSLFIEDGNANFYTGLMTFGAILYILSIGLIAAIFLFLFVSSQHSTKQVCKRKNEP